MNSKQNLLEKNDINHLLYTLFNLLSGNNILANIRKFLIIAVLIRE